MFKNYKFRKKHIVYAIVGVWGSVTIFLAVFLLNILFFSGATSTTALSDDLEEFQTIFLNSPNSNDLPEGFEVSRSVCTLSSDNKSFDFTISITNNTSVSQLVSYQVFFTEDYVNAYGANISNPFLNLGISSEMYLYSMEELSCEFTGVVFDSGVGFEEYFSTVYLEIMLNDDVYRVEVPVTFL